MKYTFVARAIASFALLLPVIVHASPILTPVTLIGTIRDFNSFGTPFNGVAGQVDFQNKVGDDLGIVQSVLGSDGKPVYASGSHATVSSSTSFYQWYHDDATVNRTGSTTITLTPNAAGTLDSYNNSMFFPIDGKLLAQDTSGHNYGFTTEFHTLFTYAAGKGDTFTFTGDDDVFVFINKRLAIDLGGVHPSESKPVTLDATFASNFGLVNGNSYTLDIFQAERHTTQSNFGITTSLQLSNNSVPEPTSIALLGLGLLGFAASRRKSAK